MAIDLSKVDQNSPMGATILGGGTGFRTWAPNANKVSVIAGTPALTAASASGWTPAVTDNLARPPDGTWQGFLDGVGDGDPYMFYVEGNGSSGWKRDTWARELTLTRAFTNCYCVIRDSASYPWHDKEWRTPIQRLDGLSTPCRRVVGTRPVSVKVVVA